MVNLILWIVVIFFGILNIWYLIKINMMNIVLEMQDRLLRDLLEDRIKNAENLTIDDIGDMEDFI